MKSTRHLPVLPSSLHRRLTAGALAGLTTGLISFVPAAFGQATPAAAPAPAPTAPAEATPAPAPAAAAGAKPLDSLLTSSQASDPYIPTNWTPPAPVQPLAPRTTVLPTVANVQYLGFSVEEGQTYYIVRDVRTNTSKWLKADGTPWNLPSGGAVSITGVDPSTSQILLDQGRGAQPIGIYKPANYQPSQQSGQTGPMIIDSRGANGGGRRGGNGGGGAQILAQPNQRGQGGGQQAGVLGGPGQQGGPNGANGTNGGRRGGANGQQPGQQGGVAGQGGTAGGRGANAGANAGVNGRGGNVNVNGAGVQQGNAGGRGGNTGFNTGITPTNTLTTGTTTNTANGAATRRTIVPPTGG